MADALVRSEDLPENVSETDFNDNTVRSADVAIYKGRAGVTDRIGIVNPSKVMVARTHYQKGLGYVLCTSEFKLHGETEVLHRAAPCCQHLTGEAESSKRVSCIIAQYDTKPDGSLIKPFGWKLLVWRFSDDKYDQLKNINAEWSLNEHDLLINCTDEKYQRITINVCKQSILRGDAFQKEFGEQLNVQAEALRPKLIRMLGKKLTAQELTEKLGKTQTPSIVSGSIDSPITDLADMLES